MGSLGRAAETRLKSENKRGGQEGEAEENQVVGERVRERGTKCRESDEISAWYIDHRIRDFSIFSLLNNFDRRRNRNDYPYQSLEVQTIKFPSPFSTDFSPPVDDSPTYFFSFSKSEFPKRLVAEKESLYRSMLEKNKYVKKRERRRIFFFFFIQRISVSRNEQYMTYYKDAMYR